MMNLSSVICGLTVSVRSAVRGAPAERLRAIAKMAAKRVSKRQARELEELETLQRQAAEAEPSTKPAESQEQRAFSSFAAKNRPGLFQPIS